VIKCQIRGHGCGVVVLKGIEQQIAAEQDDCHQAIYKIEGRPDLCPLISLDPYLGRPTAQLFVAVFESSASTPAAHALANE
jgi:hypothetical protein